jgi:hypothetical protein
VRRGCMVREWRFEGYSAVMHSGVEGDWEERRRMEGNWEECVNI